MKTIEKILDTVTLVLAVAMAIMLAPMLFNLKPYIIMSGSMEPAIHTGSLTYVNTNVSPEEIKEGDIIAFKLGDTTVTHRAVDIDGESFITKGDANSTKDMVAVSFENYVGKIAYSVPYMGYAAGHMRSPYLVIFVVFIGLGQVMVTVLSSIKEKET